MLHTETVAPATLEILTKFMSGPELAGFALVGGTNLSLRYGHRISDDLDLFTNSPFDIEKVERCIVDSYPRAVKTDVARQTLVFSVEGVKVDFILHDYGNLQAVDDIDGIRLLSVPDVVAMKLGAISGRGAKKDFWDVAELLNYYSIAQMIGFYKQKYSSDDIGFVIRSLAYFEDAEMQPDPVSLKDLSWIAVKEKIITAVKAFVADEL